MEPAVVKESFRRDNVGMMRTCSRKVDLASLHKKLVLGRHHGGAAILT